MNEETFRRLMRLTEAAMSNQECVEIPKTVDEILQGVEIATLQYKVKYLNHIVHQFHAKRESLEKQLKAAEDKAEKHHKELVETQLRNKRLQTKVTELTGHLQAQAMAEASRNEELEELRTLVGMIQARLNGGLPEGATENHAGIVLQQVRNLITPQPSATTIQ